MEDKDYLQEVNKEGCACPGCAPAAAESMAEGTAEGEAAGCPQAAGAANPWPPGTAYVTSALAGIPVALGTYALLKKAPRRLPLLVSIWVALATVVRQVVCCRCEYYGQECSTLAGIWTAGRYERDEENPLTAEAFQLDFGLIGASMLYPLPEVVKMGKSYLAAYLLAVAAGGIGIKQLACKYCPNDVCLMNPDHRKRPED